MLLNTFFWESVRRFHTESARGPWHTHTHKRLRPRVQKKMSLRNEIHSWNLWNLSAKPPKFAKEKCNFPAEVWCGKPSVVWTQSEYHCKQKCITFVMECFLSRASPYSMVCNTMMCCLCWSARSSVLIPVLCYQMKSVILYTTLLCVTWLTIRKKEVLPYVQSLIMQRENMHQCRVYIRKK